MGDPLLLVYIELVVDGKRNHQFRPGTTFNDILNLYDRHLRMLVMDANLDHSAVRMKDGYVLN